MKPFTFSPQQNSSSCMCGKDYPGRVQVKEGSYAGGGARSAYIGRSDGNLGMEMSSWPVQNTNPFGSMFGKGEGK